MSDAMEDEHLHATYGCSGVPKETLFRSGASSAYTPSFVAMSESREAMRQQMNKDLDVPHAYDLFTDTFTNPQLAVVEGPLTQDEIDTLYVELCNRIQSYTGLSRLFRNIRQIQTTSEQNYWKSRTCQYLWVQTDPYWQRCWIYMDEIRGLPGCVMVTETSFQFYPTRQPLYMFSGTLLEGYWSGQNFHLLDIWFLGGNQIDLRPYSWFSRIRTWVHGIKKNKWFPIGVEGWKNNIGVRDIVWSQNQSTFWVCAPIQASLTQHQGDLSSIQMVDPDIWFPQDTSPR